jgi:cellulose synthase/poly-beta-1,6-N-acetylglucosamine synthase-like glycosyltransferase
MVPDEEKRTRVTVLVPAYNEQETIRQSIQGVIDADFGEAQCEIIVVDDCSTDRTAEIAESMAWKLLREASWSFTMPISSMTQRICQTWFARYWLAILLPRSALASPAIRDRPE